MISLLFLLYLSGIRSVEWDSLKVIKAFLGVWRHTCLSVDFQTGKLILVENGQLLKETVSEELTQMFQVFAFSNSLSDWVKLLLSKMIVWLLHNTLILPGADVWQDHEQHHNWVQLPQSNATSTGLHEHAGTTLRRKRTNIWKTTNLQGRVTDAQLWSRILSMEEMVATTSCKSFPEGDLLPWNSQSWHLNTSRQTATTENLDLQDEVWSHTYYQQLVPIGRCVGTRTLPSCRSLLVEKSRRSKFAGGKKL